MADVVLVASLIVPLQTVLDEKHRKETLPNLSRYVAIILEGKAFIETYGKVHFAKRML